MLLIQTVTSTAVYTASVLAPVAAVDYGVSATWIGGYVSLLYVFAMVSGTLTGDWMRRIGTVGGALTGVVAPLLAAAVGWRWAAVVIGLFCLCSVVALLPLIGRFGKTPNTGTRSVTEAFRHSIASVLRIPRLRTLALAGMIYSGIQVSVAAFLVVYLTERFSLSLVEAGGIFASCQIAGIVGRLAWGAIADNLIDAIFVLVWISVISLAALVALAMTGDGVSQWTLVVIAIAVGFSSFGWNGVFLSEITGKVESESVGDTIGGIQFFFFGGVVVLPPVFGICAQIFGYRSAYLALAVLAVVGGLCVLRASRQ